MRSKKRILVQGTACISLVSITLALLPPSPAQAAGEFQVHMSPTGTDTADGLSPVTAVKTLERVEQIIVTAQPTTDVEVRIGQGTYVAGQTTWSTYIPGHTITFMPVDYEYGEGFADIAGRPVFHGDGSGNTDTGGYWLVAMTPGATTGLRFYYLTVENYIHGLAIRGDYQTIDGYRVPVGPGANGNRVFGMVFRYLGSKWAPDDGHGAVVLANSSGNEVRNNIFRNLENQTTGIMHGLYIEHGAQNNVIVGNRFTDIFGAPVRIRNLVDGTDVYHNRFERTGSVTAGAYSEWFCGDYCVGQSPTSAHECASINGTFWENETISNYTGGNLPDTTISPGGLENAGGTGCPPLSGPRVTAWDNT